MHHGFEQRTMAFFLRRGLWGAACGSALLLTGCGGSDAPAPTVPAPAVPTTTMPAVPAPAPADSTAVTPTPPAPPAPSTPVAPPAAPSAPATPSAPVAAVTVPENLEGSDTVGKLFKFLTKPAADTAGDVINQAPPGILPGGGPPPGFDGAPPPGFEAVPPPGAPALETPAPDAPAPPATDAPAPEAPKE